MVGLFLNLICFSTGVSSFSKGPLYPEVDVPSIPLSWGAPVPLGDLAGFPILGVLCLITGLCRVLRVFCPVLGILWSVFDLGRQGFFHIFSSSVEMIALIYFPVLHRLNLMMFVNYLKTCR